MNKFSLQGEFTCTKTLQKILIKMALSHFLRQSHFAVIAYICFAYNEKDHEKTAIKRCFICETNPFFKPKGLDSVASTERGEIMHVDKIFL